MLIYLAGPLFSDAERRWLDDLAERLRREGFDCFVPHEQFGGLKELTPDEVFRVDAEGARSANVLLAWLDGPVVDDGTACEIGLFAQLVAGGHPHYRGIVGIVTDLRLQRRRDNTAGDGMNLFVAGAIQSAGRICWSVDEAVDALRVLDDPSDEQGRLRGRPRESAGCSKLAGMQQTSVVLSFGDLRDFVQRRMRMSHVYQPLVISSLLEAGGAATVRQLAGEFQRLNEPQLRRMEQRIRKMPLPVLRRHGVVFVDGDLVRHCAATRDRRVAGRLAYLNDETPSPRYLVEHVA